MAKQKAVAKSTDRGKFLTTIIVLMFVFYVYWTFLLLTNMNGDRDNFLSGPSWQVIYNVVFFFVDWASIYGLWKFKKWGLYLFVGSILAGLVVMVFDPAQEPMSVPMQIALLVFMLIIFGLPSWAIKRKWHLFK